MVRAVSYVQYMPQNPIKHGINLFSLYYGYTAVLLLFVVYVGEEDDSNNSALKFCNKLSVDAVITSVQVQVLYTDNYYTSVKLAEHMFENMDGQLLELFYQHIRSLDLIRTFCSWSC